jgi:hypothetical protein
VGSQYAFKYIIQAYPVDNLVYNLLTLGS